MQGEYVQWLPPKSVLAAERAAAVLSPVGQSKYRIRDIRFIDPVAAEQFIEGGQRGRQLRAAAAPPFDHRPKRRPSAGIAGVRQLEFTLQFQRMRVDLPAGGRVRLRKKADHLPAGV